AGWPRSEEAAVASPPAAGPWWRRLGRGGDARRRVPGNDRLDAAQAAAVLAGDGVVQVIAPAGSGKTTVLVERVKELQRRGTPAGRILCLSFNRDAKEEIGVRLQRAGVAGVVVRSFHGLGLAILQAEGRAGASVGEMTDDELTGLAGAVAAPRGEQPWAPARLRETLSGFKLAAMVTPAEARAAAADPDADPDAEHAAALYEAYERSLASRGRLDFDDLVARTVRLLQDDPAVRRRWQAAFARVLVDEYQDIEPAQALLVGLLAAPEDSLFCVGDEDQCIYAWRRATVRRIIELDQVYPGLERHALAHNYRCGRRIVTASRRLIEHNEVRFRKPLRAGGREKGVIVVGRCRDRREAAALVAHLISDADPTGCAVLARTSRLLAEVADACGGAAPVELATIHAAKGREWERVIIYAADEGQTPHRTALGEEGGLEDERRLFYVALTRAKRRLEIVCTRGRESRFLGEAWIG
ncbi:ATP-dependent helicase, partial [bacterium]|nr:ATP-dependent helicase [bacterium]